MRGIKGKTAVVTAGTDGIGFAAAERLAELGAKVFVSSRKQKNVDRAVKELKDKGYEADGIVCHVGKSDHRKAMIEACVNKYGKIDFLILNAGVNPGVIPFMETSEEMWDKIFDINVKAQFLLAREALPEMNDGGAMVTVSSTSGYMLSPAIGAYSVSKMTFVGLTRMLAMSCADRQIRVNGVAPGVIRTRMSSVFWKDPEAEKASGSQAFLQRIGEPHEMGGTIAFLCSDDAGYINGETIVASGGSPSRM
eukprot:Clim_evm14s232 gene=Clim_evmTU14s232